jgi:hypothetical protein
MRRTIYNLNYIMIINSVQAGFLKIHSLGASGSAFPCRAWERENSLAGASGSGGGRRPRVSESVGAPNPRTHGPRSLDFRL